MPKILVADDNTNIQKMVLLAFEDRGISVVAVGNGEAAVRRIPDMQPDLVLADIFMPVRNGYEVCEFVKKDSRFSHIPVILLVGAFDPLDEKEARRVGADGVLKKPFVPPDPLIAMVLSALEKNPKLVAEMAKAREAAAAPAPEPLPAALEAPARAEIKPLPSYPEPTAEEAALVYGFGSGKRGTGPAAEPVEDDAPLALETDVETEDEAESGHDWRRNAMDFEIPEETSKRTAFALDDDALAMFPSEKDVPPKHVAPVQAIQQAVQQAIQKPIQKDEPKRLDPSDAQTVIRSAAPAPSPAALQAPVSQIPVAAPPAPVKPVEPEPVAPAALSQAPVAAAPVAEAPAPVLTATQYRQPWLAESAEEEPVAATPSDRAWAPPASSRKEEMPPPVWLSETEIEPEKDTETEPDAVPEIDESAQEAPLQAAPAVPHALVPTAGAETQPAAALVDTSAAVTAPDSEVAFSVPSPVEEPEVEQVAEHVPEQETEPVTATSFGTPAAHWLDAMSEPPAESKQLSYKPVAQDPALEVAPVVKAVPDALLETPEKPVLGPIKADSNLVAEDTVPTGSYGVRPEPMAPSYTFGDGKPSVSPRPELIEEPVAQASETQEVAAVSDEAAPSHEAALSHEAAENAPAEAAQDREQPADERVPTAEPPSREILATIPFLTPPPDFLAMARKEAEAAESGKNAPEDSHSNGDTHAPAAASDQDHVDAVVRAVLEKLQPQLQDLLSQGVLKPLVENILHKELAKKD